MRNILFAKLIGIRKVMSAIVAVRVAVEIAVAAAKMINLTHPIKLNSYLNCQSVFQNQWENKISLI